MLMGYVRRSALICAFFVAFVHFVQLVPQSADEVQAKYQSALELFQTIQDQEKTKDHKSLVQLFSLLEKPSALLIKQMRQDVQRIKKALKKDASKKLQDLRDQLQRLSCFIKKHKINYDAIVFHNSITKLYQLLFEKVDNNEDVVAFIAENKDMLDLKSDDNRFLHTFIYALKQASNKVSQYEDYLHGDDVDLKLQNYVLKIELVKLRNTILFDKRYKLQK